jgi:hypothetical protein
MHPGTVAALLAVLVCLLGGEARADAGAELAQACYNAVNAGKLELACRVCEEAVAANDEAHAKSSALMNLGRCEESRGRLVRAVGHYRDARALMQDDDVRADTVDGRIDALAPRIGRLELGWGEVPADAELRIDGEAVSGRPAEVPIDPGERSVTVTAPGRQEHQETLSVADGATVSLALRLGPPLPEPVPAPDPTHADDGAGDGQRIAALVVGGFGVLGLVAFGVTGGLVLDRQATVDEHCPEVDDGPRRCVDDAGVEAADEGKTLGIVNAVSLGIGLAAIGAALVLFLTAPDDEVAGAPDVGLAIGPDGAGLSFGAPF